MAANRKPVVRLASSEPAKKPAAPAPAGQIVKIAVRLDEGVNEALRSRIRYRGDLTAFTLEALDAVDLGKVQLVDPTVMARDTTISLPRDVYRQVKRAAEERGSSMNILVNTALAHWLAGQGAVRLG